MDALVIDLTHGGMIISLELSKLNLFNNIWAWDIYQTISPSQRELLIQNKIKLIDSVLDKNQDLKNIKELNSFLKQENTDFNINNININTDTKIISPVHCPLSLKPDFTHHQAIKLILDESKRLEIKKSSEKHREIFSNSNKIPVIEVTGVKGKTSIVGMLKEILKPLNPLILSSLGAEVFKCAESAIEPIILKKNISITPASIIETVQMAKDYDYGVCIFEISLGATGMADVGLLTNVAENYPIANKKSSASIAKEQIFDSKMVCCEFETFSNYYSHLRPALKDKLNTFSFDHSNLHTANPHTSTFKNTILPNLFLKNVEYGLENSIIDIKTHHLKTIDGNSLDLEFTVKTFAPSDYQVKNVLASACCALTLGQSPQQIIDGLKNFTGLEGRSSVEKIENVTIIEEINPGINITAIENAIFMAQNLESPFIILGGQYGITCEEIDENETAELLSKIFFENENFDQSKNPEKSLKTIPLALNDELGKGIHRKLVEKSYNQINYFPEPEDSIKWAIDNGAKNIIFIYRSNYSNLRQR